MLLFLLMMMMAMTILEFQFIIPTKSTLLLSTNIKWDSETCVGTCVPSSGRKLARSLKAE